MPCLLLAFSLLASLCPLCLCGESPFVLVGFAETDITPKLGDKPVYIAGFGQNRKATGVLDPLKARAVVFKHAGQRLAVVSVDLVGYFHAEVEQVRTQLPGFTYVLVTSTHNHEGPDTLGLWGPGAFKSGVDPDYLKLVRERIVQAVQDADGAAAAVTATIGTARAPELLHDGREPYVKHDELVALQFQDPRSRKSAGIVVQWNCHPETLDSKNTLLSADYVGYTVDHLRKRYGCPVVYLTGTVGGLMTSLHVPIKNDKGELLKDGTVEKTQRYGRLVGELTEKALKGATPVRLTPLAVRSREVFLPLHNPNYLIARATGILQRQAYLWAGDPYQAEPAGDKPGEKPLCIKTEVAYLRLGDLDVACIPGEIYPELVLDKVQDPPDPGADFPDAPVEPAVYKQLRGPHRMIVGLANDEVGYILPKRQWDRKEPFCYGRKKEQYGEVNSVGPEVGPILCKAFQELARGK